MALHTSRPITILIAEDDPDDRLLSQEALEELSMGNHLHFVQDGEELLDYLCHFGEFTDQACSPRPELILLDLNMPRRDGREALKEIKNNPELRRIPIVVFTTSKSDEDIVQSYNLGIGGYITKPVSYQNLIHVMKTVCNYWFDIVQRPPY